jgi:hypothetical protein
MKQIIIKSKIDKQITIKSKITKAIIEPIVEEE